MRTRLMIAAVACAVLWVALGLSLPVSSANSRSTQWSEVKEGVGVGEILINRSTRTDVIKTHGRSFKLIEHGDYSREMDYGPMGLTFYYCNKDANQKIFLVELHKGMTSTGIIIGQSTMREVLEVYGKPADDPECDESPCEYDYPGIQFYFERDPNVGPSDLDPNQRWKVVEADIVASDTSANFCDEY